MCYLLFFETFAIHATHSQIARASLQLLTGLIHDKLGHMLIIHQASFM